MNSQQKLIALAGGSAFVVVLGFALFVFKRRNQNEEEEEDENLYDENGDLIKSHNELPDLNTAISSAAQSVTEILVPKRIVGSIIGKQGSNIKQLRNEFAVR